MMEGDSQHQLLGDPDISAGTLWSPLHWIQIYVTDEFEQISCLFLPTVTVFS